MNPAADLPLDLPPSQPVDVTPVPRRRRARWLLGAFALVLAASLALGWLTHQRLRQVERELARRQQETQTQSAEARLLASQSQEIARDTAAKVALLDARLAEIASQRSQLESLIQSMSRSRDENLLVEIDAALRVAQQQVVLTGSAEPLVVALRQTDERLARYGQPRLEAVRRAANRDLDRIKTLGVPDLAALALKLDEVVRLADELPLLSQALPRQDAQLPRSAAAVPPLPASGAGLSDWWSVASQTWRRVLDSVWSEARSLVRVTRIDHPDAALMAPDQSFFVRENLKLRLLNARLGLLGRQFETAQTDLQFARQMLERYYDPSSRRTGSAMDLVRQVQSSGRSGGLPRAEETLAALSSVSAAR